MAGKDSQFETFDSGDGPTIPDSKRGDYAHRDSSGGLSSKGDEGQDKEQGIPSVPMK